MGSTTVEMKSSEGITYIIWSVFERMCRYKEKETTRITPTFLALVYTWIVLQLVETEKTRRNWLEGKIKSSILNTVCLRCLLDIQVKMSDKIYEVSLRYKG